ncbi:unnamed protein product [Closterium sp. NIES-65]|nr:unnamed protein product [Closterium sp. NIES-65]
MGMAEQRRLAEREVEELQMSVLGQGEMVLQGETMGGVGTGKEEMGKAMGEEMGSARCEAVCHSICRQLPGSSLHPLAPVLRQFMAFHDSVGALTDESRQLLRQVIVFCASHKQV